MKINREHYFPSFIALNVDELRDNKNTRKTLKKYKIFTEIKKEEDEEDDGSQNSAISKNKSATLEEKSLTS